MSTVSFKRGHSSRIDIAKTPFQEGNIYVTTDDGKVYMDVIDNGDNKRLLLGGNTPSSEHSSSITVNPTEDTYTEIWDEHGVQFKKIFTIESDTQYKVELFEGDILKKEWVYKEKINGTGYDII